MSCCELSQLVNVSLPQRMRLTPPAARVLRPEAPSGFFPCRRARGAGWWPGLPTFPTRHRPGRPAWRPAARSRQDAACLAVGWLALDGTEMAQVLKRRQTSPREQVRDARRPLRVGRASWSAVGAAVEPGGIWAL